MVHELDMREGTARCIDLPGNGDFMASGSYALALSRDGRTLYAASGANGTVVTIDGAAQRVAAVAHVPKATSVIGSSGLVLPSAALSRDGKRLAFSLNGTMWIYDLAAGQLVRKWTSVVGAIAYSRNGVLWVVGTDGGARRAER